MSKERWTYVVLSIFLILSGLTAFLPTVGFLGIIMAVLAIAAGVLIFITKPKVSNTTGWILAAVYFILMGLKGLFSFGLAWDGIVLGIMALIAAILMLLKWPGFKKHIGFVLFILWLILTGLMGIFGLGMLSVVTAIVALASGLFMLLDQ